MTSSGTAVVSYLPACRTLLFVFSDDEIPSGSDEETGGEERKRRRGPPKRKLEMEDYPEFMAKRFADFRTYRDNTLQKWHDKTKLASGKLGKASLGAQVRAFVCIGVSHFPEMFRIASVSHPVCEHFKLNRELQ